MKRLAVMLALALALTLAGTSSAQSQRHLIRTQLATSGPCSFIIGGDVQGNVFVTIRGPACNDFNALLVSLLSKNIQVTEEDLNARKAAQQFPHAMPAACPVSSLLDTDSLPTAFASNQSPYDLADAAILSVQNPYLGISSIGLSNFSSELGSETSSSQTPDNLAPPPGLALPATANWTVPEISSDSNGGLIMTGLRQQPSAPSLKPDTSNFASPETIFISATQTQLTLTTLAINIGTPASPTTSIPKPTSGFGLLTGADLRDAVDNARALESSLSATTGIPSSTMPTLAGLSEYTPLNLTSEVPPFAGATYSELFPPAESLNNTPLEWPANPPSTIPLAYTSAFISSGSSSLSDKISEIPPVAVSALSGLREYASINPMSDAAPSTPATDTEHPLEAAHPVPYLSGPTLEQPVTWPSAIPVAYTSVISGADSNSLSKTISDLSQEGYQVIKWSVTYSTEKPQ